MVAFCNLVCIKDLATL